MGRKERTMPIFTTGNPFDPFGQKNAPHVEVITPKKKKEPKTAQRESLYPVLISLLVTAVLGFLYFYFELPALNFQNEEFISSFCCCWLYFPSL